MDGTDRQFEKHMHMVANGLMLFYVSNFDLNGISLSMGFGVLVQSPLSMQNFN